jgi:protein TonB
MITAAPPPPPPPPPPVAAPPPPPERVRVGGQVQSARLVNQARPVYPPLARQARVQGTVRLEAVINKDGVIEELKVISGHPLLVQAALDAVQQWRYQPTLLNGVAVEVITTIDVNFTLGG